MFCFCMHVVLPKTVIKLTWLLVFLYDWELIFVNFKKYHHFPTIHNFIVLFIWKKALTTPYVCTEIRNCIQIFVYIIPDSRLPWQCDHNMSFMIWPSLISHLYLSKSHITTSNTSLPKHNTFILTSYRQKQEIS